MSALSLEGVRIALRDRALVDGLDLAIEAGRCVSLMGPSGCGKSTLLNLVAGLDTPTDGEIILAGESIVVPRSPNAT